MRVHEITENLASTLVKGAAQLAPKIAPLTVGQKLRSVLNNMPPLDRLDPPRARMHYDQLMHSLRPIADDDAAVARILQFMRSQESNPQPAQVLQMVVKQLKSIPGS
jgi:hypothetical protein